MELLPDPLANLIFSIYCPNPMRWGEYKITFTRPSSSDAITVTDLAIHSLTDEEVTKVGNITTPNLTVDGNSCIYDISGNQHSHPVKGINIINNKKVIVNRK